MKILVYRYNSICEPPIIRAFQTFGIEMDEIRTEMTNKNLTPAQQVKLLSEKIQSNNFDAVFSINFFPSVSEVCNIFRIPYICWTVDSPVMELYSDSICNEWNRIFLFDHAQYEEFYPRNPEHIYYLPLAADVDYYDGIIGGFSDTAISGKNQESSDGNINEQLLSRSAGMLNPKFAHDVCFIGSLYTEKSPYRQIAPRLPEELHGFLDGLMAAQLQVYGYNFLEECITEEQAKEYFQVAKAGFPEKSQHNYIAALAQRDLGNEIAAMEREGHLKALSEFLVNYSIPVENGNAAAEDGKHLMETSYSGSAIRNSCLDLYTFSNTTNLPMAKVHPEGAKSLTEAPQIFRQTKINLNFTTKSIRTGLPLRIFDIMGCGGFVLSNYQAEIPEYFSLGEHLDTFGSKEELLEKTAYYLEHDKERQEIARAGYDEVKAHHTWIHRCSTLLTTAFGK